MTMDGYLEEGDFCPECRGTQLYLLEYIRVNSCSCHINPPCSSCVDAPLLCPECHFNADEYNDDLELKQKNDSVNDIIMESIRDFSR